jgi:pheromone a factor receptor
VLIDLSIVLGIPILQMIISYIPQGHRFDIFQEIGCYPTIYDTPVAYALVLTWPVVIGLGSMVYSSTLILLCRTFFWLLIFSDSPPAYKIHQT